MWLSLIWTKLSEPVGAGSEEAQQADGITAHVHGRAAGQGQLVADVALLPEGCRERDVHVGDVAELTGTHDLDEALGQRVVLVVERLHHDQTRGAVRRTGHRPGQRHSQRHRL